MLQFFQSIKQLHDGTIKLLRGIQAQYKWRKRMRDKVLCRAWARTKQSNPKEKSSLFGKGSPFVLWKLSCLLLAVPVSIRGGVKMRIDRFSSFFDYNAAWRNQKAQTEFFEQPSKKDLDTIFATESLFKGTIVDFSDLGSYSGGVNCAKHCSAIN
jgi:hypothetical protein